ncbi:HAMP domain-containing histidine kinase [Trichothermofontia sichuanensis B231]|uniref:sensor histidine kinase n=1 Tax=Trichothermofontia sichuanensis TaxID=3045816 RepID=UPI002247A82F|nr:HAMP domain-containing sensor histidine kinase [Trichothermofontia sichuanensis]UZQ52794.1 HAMP domain-containing histidine kinase [Trichothermofontia sichuanensis B231]
MQSLTATVWQWFNQQTQRWQARPSSDYRRYRQQFLRDRVRLLGLVMLGCGLLIALHHYVLGFIDPTQFDAEMSQASGDATLGSRLRAATVPTLLLAVGVPAISLGVLQTRWGYRHPALIFLGISFSITLPTQIIGTLYGLAIVPEWTWIFLGQAVLVPTHWRLHVLSQCVPIAYYLIGFPMAGLTQFSGESIYDITNLTQLTIVCLICDVGLFTYEQMQKREQESHKQLEVLLHSVSHDLQTPLLGTSLWLKSILDNSEDSNNPVSIPRNVLERLQESNDRQLTLIRSLLEAYQTEQQAQQLNCQPLQMSTLIREVLTDLQPLLNDRQVNVHQPTWDKVPTVYADAMQLWRVFCNLITNALKHNPPKIDITLTAETIKLHHRSYLRCTVQDTGTGIEPNLSRRLFQRYVRGDRAHYQPGLGLGLYVCRRIIQAHGGQIGVISTVGQGTTFWFTLPLQ